MIRIYIITFFSGNVNIDAMNKIITGSPYFSSYWNYLPLVYCVKSTYPANEIRAHLDLAFIGGNFMIAEINPHNLDGRLAQEAWDWFYKNDAPKSLAPSTAPRNFLGPTVHG